jgi:hypothetical protein
MLGDTAKESFLTGKPCFFNKYGDEIVDLAA